MNSAAVRVLRVQAYLGCAKDHNRGDNGEATELIIAEMLKRENWTLKRATSCRQAGPQ